MKMNSVRMLTKVATDSLADPLEWSAKAEQ